MLERRVTFLTTDDKEIVGILRFPAETGTFPLAILCHGMRATKNDLIIAMLARELPYAGFATLRFDYLHHGESWGEFRFMTLTQEIADTKAAVTFAKSLPTIDPKRIILIGHSLGGNAAVAAVARGVTVTALCTINTRAVLAEYIHSYCDDDQLLEWRRTGETLLLGQYPLRKSFLDDFAKHDTLADIAKVKCPILICQGTADMRTPVSSARQLAGAATAPHELALIEGADHGFRDAGKQRELVNTIVEWLRGVL